MRYSIGKMENRIRTLLQKEGISGDLDGQIDTYITYIHSIEQQRQTLQEELLRISSQLIHQTIITVEQSEIITTMSIQIQKI